MNHHQRSERCKASHGQGAQREPESITAARLQAEGEEVAFLGLFDPSVPDAMQEARYLENEFHTLIKIGQESGLVAPTLDEVTQQNWLRVYRASVAAIQQHQMGPYPGDALLLQEAEAPPGWDPHMFRI